MQPGQNHESDAMHRGIFPVGPLNSTNGSALFGELQLVSDTLMS